MAISTSPQLEVVGEENTEHVNYESKPLRNLFISQKANCSIWLWGLLRIWSNVKNRDDRFTKTALKEGSEEEQRNLKKCEAGIRGYCRIDKG
ncbi:hypothetical protein C1645_816158 [Glomus cerebriforme]|uniref:Uncharacterized protein n=1 Tax=Glomus cerebriforme TaxID=658196 RepID=A0A397TEU6_9GLOM|nr:hypothetical protein C1645_816158 [Glomus cerebriforme]